MGLPQWLGENSLFSLSAAPVALQAPWAVIMDQPGLSDLSALPPSCQLSPAMGGFLPEIDGVGDNGMH